MKNFYPKGILADGAFRKHDLVKIYTDPGGMRTVALKHIVQVR